MAMENVEKPRNGVKRQLLGSVLFFLALLNIALIMKSGLAIDYFDYALAAAGSAVFLSGLLSSKKEA